MSESDPLQGSVGLPGTTNVYIMVPQFEGKAPENDERIGDLSEREFVVMGELAKHLVPEPTEISYELKEDEGESYLLLGEGKGHGEFSTPIGDYHISKNSEDEASTIQMQLSGKNWNFVIRDFLNGINPVLDHLSFRGNFPIGFSKIICVDPKNSVRYIVSRCPYGRKIIPSHFWNTHVQLLPVYALWRESKNTSSDFYKFLCLFKILEGVLLKLRHEVAVAAKNQGIKVAKRKLLVPCHPELEKFHKEYVGKSIQGLFEGELRKEFRDAVAHFLLKDGTLMNPSSHSWETKFQNMAKIVEVCAVRVIEEQESLLNEFFEAGGRLPDTV